MVQVAPRGDEGPRGDASRGLRRRPRARPQYVAARRREMSWDAVRRVSLIVVVCHTGTIWADCYELAAFVGPLDLDAHVHGGLTANLERARWGRSPASCLGVPRAVRLPKASG